jgi:hypothetical protein
MIRREDMERILNAESERWSSMSSEQLIAELRELQAYQVEDGNQKYQIEVELLENTDAYVHVMVAVDDGRLPYSIKPLTQTFIQQKQPVKKND